MTPAFQRRRPLAHSDVVAIVQRNLITVNAGPVKLQPPHGHCAATISWQRVVLGWTCHSGVSDLGSALALSPCAADKICDNTISRINGIKLGVRERKLPPCLRAFQECNAFVVFSSLSVPVCGVVSLVPDKHLSPLWGSKDLRKSSTEPIISPCFDFSHHLLRLPTLQPRK